MILSHPSLLFTDTLLFGLSLAATTFLVLLAIGIGRLAVEVVRAAVIGWGSGGREQ